MSANTTIIVLGASGDLACKKTYPALWDLYKGDLLPKNTNIHGFARSHYELEAFRARISSKFKATDNEKAMIPAFLNRCSYHSGNYDDPEAFKRLEQACIKGEICTGDPLRIYYMALPPSVFIDASRNLKLYVYSKTGVNRLVVEKPFGKDSSSSNELSRALSELWTEQEIYRIDHYLGKEMVKNLMVIRFANVMFGSIWNRQFIDNVQITFKEPIGTEGRGGYFDEFGIIRDIMQNHLLQILTITAMDKPVSLNAEDVRNEKVKVLRAISPLTVNDVLIGQYYGSKDGSNPGYLDDKGVTKDSIQSTFAAAAFYIKTERWDGVPFILKCGKALNEQKAEIRIQFQDIPGNIYGDISRNELVIRVQPNEAVYMKFMNKKPGQSSGTQISELDLSYNKRYSGIKIPDAYESLILDVLKGDKSNFVRDDELELAWKIFTPLLHSLENEKIKPEKYEFGTRGPASIDRFIAKHGYRRSQNYEWNGKL